MLLEYIVQVNPSVSQKKQTISTQKNMVRIYTSSIKSRFSILTFSIRVSPINIEEPLMKKRELDLDFGNPTLLIRRLVKWKMVTF